MHIITKRFCSVGCGKYALICNLQEAGNHVKQLSCLNSGVFHGQWVIFVWSSLMTFIACCSSSCYHFEMEKRNQSTVSQQDNSLQVISGQLDLSWFVLYAASVRAGNAIRKYLGTVISDSLGILSCLGSRAQTFMIQEISVLQCIFSAWHWKVDSRAVCLCFCSGHEAFVRFKRTRNHGIS